jgi:hypothetical protein
LIGAYVETGQTGFRLACNRRVLAPGEAALDYRLYFLDAQGHVRDRADLECEDDGHAVQVAERHADGRAMELWRRAILIRKFPLPEGPKGP